jgi:cystathionine beta-lyase family protein involved in aluminum resistance
MMTKLQELFRKNGIDSSAFNGVNGYGYGDLGREKYDSIIASLFGAEAALVRLQMFSGTHAISTALFASVRPGDQILGISGKPYDTLEEVLGLRNNTESGNSVGSLLDWGITYDEVDLIFGEMASSINSGVVAFDLHAIDEKLERNPSIKLIHIQRSCGYQFRPSIPIKEIGRVCSHLEEKYKKKGRNLVIFVDNCYGELVEDLEPTHVGADLAAGSLIKNLGGTLAPCGGYIVGRRCL